MTDLVWTLPAQPNQTARWEEPQGGGGGGSQDLAQVLVVGGDPEGNPITGAVTISPSDPTVPQLVVNGAADPDDEYTSLIELRDADNVGRLLVDNHGGTVINADGTDGSSIVLKAGTKALTVEGVGGGEAGIGFFNAAAVAQPEIPATPDAQDIADVLVALGLATQAA